MKRKIITVFFTALLLLAMSATTALAGDFDVNAKYYSQETAKGYKVTAVISPMAGKNYGLSYVENVYLLVSKNGKPYERIYFADHDLTNEHTSASATIEVAEGGAYTFTICMGNDAYEIGKKIVNKQEIPSTYAITILSLTGFNPFSDVKDNLWYTDYVCTAYALGLIKGVSETEYGPDEPMTIAQAVVLATRINQISTLGEIEDYSDYQGKWYRPYFDYAINKGFVDEAYLEKWNQNATRSQFADIFADCLPSTDLTDLHGYTDGFIPDVKMSDINGSDIYKLYNAGILQGSDSQFNFLPNTNIKRSEIAAIIVRMVVEEERIGYVGGEEGEVTD